MPGGQTRCSRAALRRLSPGTHTLGAGDKKRVNTAPALGEHPTEGMFRERCLPPATIDNSS